MPRSNSASLTAPLLALAALVAALLCLTGFYWAYSGASGRISAQNQAILDAAERRLLPHIRQREIPRSLKQRTRAMLGEPRLALNYLTVRNAQQVILVSEGNLEGIAGFLPPAQARQVRGFLYRLVSLDRRAALRREGALVGYIDYGVGLGRALPWTAFMFWLGIALAVGAGVVAFWLTGRAWAEWRERVPESTARDGDVSPTGAAAPAPPPPPPSQTREPSAFEVADRLELGLMRLNADTRVLRSNDSAAKYLGTTAEVIEGKALTHFVTLEREDGAPHHPVDKNGWPGVVVKATAANGNCVRLRWAVPGSADKGVVALWPAEPESAAPRSTSRREADWGEAFMNALAIPLAVADANGRLTARNPAWAARFEGDALPECLPQAFGDTLRPGHQTIRLSGAHGTETMQVEINRLFNGDDDRFLVALTPSAADVAEPAASTVGHLSTLGAHDDLTGLAGRAPWLDSVSSLAARTTVVLAVVDIVGLKRINRDFDHAIGDRLLAAFAARLAHALPERAHLARLGGDEFAVCVDVENDPDGTAQRVLQWLAATAERPLLIEQREIAFQLDIGGSLFPGDADDAGQALKYAELAMYAAKASASHEPRLYSPEMRAAAEPGGAEAGALRDALLEDRIVLRLWPVRGDGGRGPLCAALASVSWMVPEGEVLTDAELLDHAEEHGLLREFGAWWLRRLALAYAGWRDIGVPAVPIVVPSTALLAARTFAELCVEAMQRHQLPDKALIQVLRPGEALPKALVERVRPLPRLDREEDTGEGDAVLLGPDLLERVPEESAIATAKALAARHRYVMAGPLSDDDQASALAAVGVENLFGSAVADAQAPRAFGRLLARVGGEPL